MGASDGNSDAADRRLLRETDVVALALALRQVHGPTVQPEPRCTGNRDGTPPTARHITAPHGPVGPLRLPQHGPCSTAPARWRRRRDILKDALYDIIGLLRHRRILRAEIIGHIMSVSL